MLSFPLPLWTSIMTLGKKNDDEKTLLLKSIWLYFYKFFRIDCQKSSFKYFQSTILIWTMSFIVDLKYQI